MALNLAKFKTDLGTALKEAAALNDKDILGRRLRCNEAKNLI